MSSTPQTLTSTSQYHPSAGESPIWDAGYQGMLGLYENPQSMYPWQTFVPASQPTQSAISGMLGIAPQYAGQAGEFGDAWSRGLGASDVANNPYVQDMMAANARTVNDNLTRKMLPEIQQGAVQAGGSNNARQGIAEGVAMGDASEALANANAQTQMDAYRSGLGHEQAMMSQANALRDAGMAPMEALSRAGAGMEGYQEKALQDAMMRWMYPYQTQSENLDAMLRRVGMLKAGTQVSEQPNPNYQSPLQQGLGMASGIGSMFMPTGGKSPGV